MLEINTAKKFEFTNSRITHYFLISRVTQIMVLKYRIMQDIPRNENNKNLYPGYKVQIQFGFPT
jgi:hypothetical protein